MPFKYPCFISHVGGKHDLMTGFQEQLARKLRSALEPFFDEEPFIDRSQVPGTQFEKNLAEAICQSVCMIVVLVPKYDKHAYCRREYRAMEILQKQRLHLLGAQAKARGLIIPILLRGDLERMPDRIKNYHYCDLTNFTNAKRDLKSERDFNTKLDEIAKYIHELYEDFVKLGHDIWSDCHSFILPPDEECEPIIIKPAGFPNR